MNTQPKEPIAVIGIGCRVPGGADTPDTFWELLQHGIHAITEIPKSRWDVAHYNGAMPNHGGFVPDVDQFDAGFFHMAPKEAMTLDPQQRLLLEVSWEALEHAGINPETLRDSDTGVFVGICSNDYQLLQTKQHNEPNLYICTGTSAATASGRLSYFFGFHGPAVSTDTASSSSLVAFHQAVTSLQSGECNLALAAGVNLILDPDLSIAFASAGMLSPDGRSKGFDAAANGYVRGEGCGVVVLKCLADALHDGDNVLAIVRGTAINQDGDSQGLTVPSGASQEAVIRKALAVAGLQPHDVHYIEAHGSGTPVGDPIEGNALQAVYGNGHTTPWVIGSVKTNIGHLEAAAGIAGVIKAVLALQHEYIPPHLHFKHRNPKLAGLQAVIPTAGMTWKNGAGPRRAGVSSFGFSGTNAHVILEDAPEALRVMQQRRRTLHNDPYVERPFHLLTLSTQSEQSLQTLVQRYDDYLAAHPEVALSDVCYTANTGRAHFEFRWAAVATSAAELREQLQAWLAGASALGVADGQKMTQPPKIAFLFTGQGSQYVGMGRELYRTQPIFRQTLERCDEILRPYLGESLIGVLYPEEFTQQSGSNGIAAQAKIDETACTQPVLFALEYALAQVWRSWGIEPEIVIGHSVGEYVAACVAGVLSLEDGLKLIAARGRLMQALPQEGEMVALMTNAEQALAAMVPEHQSVSLAAINGPQSVVVSGERMAVQRVLASLPEVRATKLMVSHAFHSPLMEPMLAEFRHVAHQITFAPPHIRLISNVTGNMINAEVATPDYWVRHVRATVRFADGMVALDQQGVDLFVEIGPKPTLLGMGRQALEQLCGSARDAATAWLPSLRSEVINDWQQMLTSLAALYLHGVPVDWAGLEQDSIHRCQRLALPTYPFQRQRFWLPTTQPSRRPVSNGRVPSSHSLARQHLSLASDPATRFAFDLGQGLPPYLKHHCIFNKPVLAAGFYLSTALSSGKDIFNTDQLCLENVILEQALVLPDDPYATRTIQIVLTPREDTRLGMHVQIYSVADSADGEPNWIRQASGQLQVTAALASAKVDLANLRQHCPERIVLDTFYAQAAACNIIYRIPVSGDEPTYQILQELWHGERAALGYAQLHPGLAAEVELYSLNSILIEAGIQVAMATMLTAMPGVTYLPVGLQQLTLYRAGMTELWAYASLHPVEGEQETVSAELLLLDEAGVIAEMHGLTFKCTTPETLFRPLRRSQQAAPNKGPRPDLLEQWIQASETQGPALLTDYVQKQVCQVLGLRLSQPLSPERPLKDLGLDSLMSTELKNRFERELKVMIPAEQMLRSGISIESLSTILLGKLTLKKGGSSVPLPFPSVSDPAEAEDFSAAAAEVPQIHAVVTEQIGRKVKVEGRWIFDFASCNYLGIDLQPEVMAAIPPALEKWGVHPSWTRAVASPAIYEELEQELADLVGAPSTLVFPAVTLLHFGVIPVLVGYDGVILKDISAHRSIFEACRLAQTNGAEFVDFKHNDPADLEAKLARYPYERIKIIAIDGVYSMSGAYPPLPEFARLAKKHNAWVYMDDAHGLGVIGENPTPEIPYGHQGNGIVRYYGLDYARDRLIYVAGLSKSFSSFGAFITCSDETMKHLFRSASTFIFSGPSPVASLASALAGLRLNRREGEVWRAQVYKLTHRLVTGSKAMGFEVVNENYFPIVGVVIGKTRDTIEACKILWEYGILITPALYPIVPRDRGLLRFSVTAANTEEQIERSLEALAAVWQILHLKEWA